MYQHDHHQEWRQSRKDVNEKTLSRDDLAEEEPEQDPREIEEEEREETEEEAESPTSAEKDEKDLEKQLSRLQKSQSRTSSKRSLKDPNLVDWDGPDDTANPKNWTYGRKWAATFVVSSFTFISPVSSSMVAPALASMSSDLGITSEIESQLVLSIFILSYAIGPLFLGPISEVYGRVHVLQYSNVFFFAWTLGCGFAQTKGQMIAFRLLSGLGGSAPLSIGGGVLSDCWSADERGKAISIYSLAPLLGPAVGPIAGGWIAENTTWRWVFYSVAAVDFLIFLSGIFFLQETYGPRILHVKAAALRKETGNSNLQTEFEHPERTLGKIIRTALVRPFRLLGTQPIIQCIALYQAYLYGVMYLILSTFPTLWTGIYHESVGIGSLNYISLGLGFTAGTQITAPLNDAIYRRLKARNNGVGKPEYRVPLMFIGSALIPIGLFWYGWSAQAQIHWIMPNIGACLFAAGAIVCFQCMQTYIIDSYTRFAASGVAAAVVLRSLAGFGFPLFAPYMYQALDYGWGNSLLGFLAIGIGIPSPFLFWFFGERIRGRSRFAAG